jgi:hypothetical protein
MQPRVGDAIIVGISTQAHTGSGKSFYPSDNASNTYTLVASTTFGTNLLELYYAKNVVTTSSFTVTLNNVVYFGGQTFAASILEYTGLTTSSTLDSYNSNIDMSGSSVSLTTGSATSSNANELFVGAMAPAASTTITSAAGWTSELSIATSSVNPGIYMEDTSSTFATNQAATWTSSASTSYAAILGVFTLPISQGFVATGTLDSATFDTGVASGTELNSVIWQGTLPLGTHVGFQFATSSASSGPWNFEGPTGDSTQYFGYNNTQAGVAIPLVSNVGYSLFNGGRYFRYRIILSSGNAQNATPTVTQVVVNWSP